MRLPKLYAYLNGIYGRHLAHLSLTNNCVNKIGVSVELILNDIIEDFKQEKDEVMVCWCRKEKPEERNFIMKC